MWGGLGLLAISEARATARKHIRALILTAVAALFALAAFVFAMVALHGWLTQRFTFVEASLIVTAGLVVVALIFLLAANWVKHSRNERSPAASAALVALPAAVKAIGNPKNASALGVAGVIAAGALMGRRLVRMARRDS